MSDIATQTDKYRSTPRSNGASHGVSRGARLNRPIDGRHGVDHWQDCVHRAGIP